MVDVTLSTCEGWCFSYERFTHVKMIQNFKNWFFIMNKKRYGHVYSREVGLMKIIELKSL